MRIETSLGTSYDAPPVSGLKRCTKCGHLKDRAAFYVHSQKPNCTHSECRMCTKKAARERLLEPGYSKKLSRRARVRQYGLTLSQYEKMREVQENKCAVCGSHEGVSLYANDKLHIDHDHITGAVRGLLCRPCNSAIGYMKDNVANLRKAVEYLESGRDWRNA